MVSEGVYTQISTIVGPANLKRLCGDTRFDTARLIAEEFFPNPQVAALVYSQDFPDALTGGINAASYGAPILLVNTHQLPLATEGYLVAKQESLTAVIVYGGTAVVSEAVRTAALEIIN